MDDPALPDRAESVFCFCPDTVFYVRVGLSALGVVVGGVTVGTGVLTPLGPPFGVAGLVVAAISGWSLRLLRRSWLDRPELHLSAHGVWIATVHSNAALRWREVAEIGIALHQGSEHLVARPIAQTPPYHVTMTWSPDLRGYVVAPLDGWDRPEAELRAAARAHAGIYWSDHLSP